MFGFGPKKRAKSVKNTSTVTDITFPPKYVLRSPGWHIKDDGHTYLFLPYIFIVINLICVLKLD